MRLCRSLMAASIFESTREKQGLQLIKVKELEKNARTVVRKSLAYLGKVQDRVVLV